MCLAKTILKLETNLKSKIALLNVFVHGSVQFSVARALRVQHINRIADQVNIKAVSFEVRFLEFEGAGCIQLIGQPNEHRYRVARQFLSHLHE